MELAQGFRPLQRAVGTINGYEGRGVCIIAAILVTFIGFCIPLHDGAQRGKGGTDILKRGTKRLRCLFNEEATESREVWVKHDAPPGKAGSHPRMQLSQGYPSEGALEINAERWVEAAFLMLRPPPQPGNSILLA